MSLSETSEKGLCSYKDIFGKPREGAHSYRVFDFAAVDVILTVIAGIIIARNYDLSILLVLLVLFIIGIISHKLFCVDTKLNTLIF